MTAVESSPAGLWGEAVESQFERLEARLLAEFGDGLIAGRTVRDHIAAARAHYVGARVRIYLPILIERDVRRQLQKPDAPGPRVPPEPPDRDRGSSCQRRANPGSGTVCVIGPGSVG